MSGSSKSAGKNKYHLLIKYLAHRNVQSGLRYRVGKWIPFYRHGLVQGYSYETGLLIRNLGDKPFPGAIIKDVQIKDVNELRISGKKEYAVPQINPKHEQEIWMEAFNLGLCGTCWATCTIVPKESNSVIITYQYNKASGEPEEYLTDVNRWGDFIWVSSRSEYLQSRANSILIILTALVFIDGIWGLGASVRFVIGGLLAILGNIIDAGIALINVAK